jgi:hypothetical protein
MALILSNPTNPILIAGTTVELPNIYVRIEFGCRKNGTTIECAFATYENKTMYESGNMIQTNVPVMNHSGEIDLETQIQSVESAHAVAKTHYEDMGYDVVIDL